MRNASDEAGSAPGTTEVLVVDDNHSVVRALGTLLKRAGFTPTACHSGSDALNHPSVPAAAVLDVHLPDLNGLILAQRLRDRFGPTTPIIIVSGDTSMETLNSLQYVGATYFFSKPINAESLVERLKELLGDPS